MVEFLVLVACLIAIVMFFYRLFVNNSLSNRIAEKPNEFHNFEYAVIWDEVIDSSYI